MAAGKNDTIYMAHSYHTKVPHQAILRYVLHYTKPGDVILDGFGGSGMTGVAATLCSDLPSEERAAVEREMPGVRWGRRTAILNDISPAASFIAHNYNAKVDLAAFLRDAAALLAHAEKECGGTLPHGTLAGANRFLAARWFFAVRGRQLHGLVGGHDVPAVCPAGRLLR